MNLESLIKDWDIILPGRIHHKESELGRSGVISEVSRGFASLSPPAITGIFGADIFYGAIAGSAIYTLATIANLGMIKNHRFFNEYFQKNNVEHPVPSEPRESNITTTSNLQWSHYCYQGSTGLPNSLLTYATQNSPAYAIHINITQPLKAKLKP